MATINFKHLRYFWAVAKSGSIAHASAQLHVTPQSISSQLALLEEALGTGLFRRAGRGLEMTDVGRRIVSYAEEIFGLEDELLAAVRHRGSRTVLPFRIGIADSVPKSLTYRVVEPALHMEEAVRLICKEGRLVSLLAELSVHRLDLVIADRTMPTDLKVRAYNHLLGSSDVTVFGAEALLKTLKGAFPEVVDNAPFLMPGAEVAIRPALEQCAPESWASSTTAPCSKPSGKAVSVCSWRQPRSPIMCAGNTTFGQSGASNLSLSSYMRSPPSDACSTLPPLPSGRRRHERCLVLLVRIALLPTEGLPNANDVSSCHPSGVASRRSRENPCGSSRPGLSVNRARPLAVRNWPIVRVSGGVRDRVRSAFVVMLRRS